MIPTTQPTPTDAPTLTPAQREEKRAAEIVLRLQTKRADLAAMLGKLDADRWIDACAQHYRNQCARSEDDALNFDGCDLGGYVAACTDAAIQQLTPNGSDGQIVIDDVVRAGGPAGSRDWSPPRWAISWRGMFGLLRRAVRAEGGDVRQFCAELVYKQEIAAGGFEVDLFTRKMRHTPFYLLGIDEEPYYRDVAVVYAAATIVAPDGSESREFRILTRASINARELAAKEANGGVTPAAWVKWPGECAQGSCVRALVDRLPGVDTVRAQLSPPPRVQSVPLALADKLRTLTEADDAPRAAIPERAAAHVVATTAERSRFGAGGEGDREPSGEG